MTTRKTTKRTLVMSALSLLLCIAMLAGTTFAWFTDSVKSENNIITAGNLDIELYWSINGKDWKKVDETSKIFSEKTLWEPGHTEVVYLKVVNEGSLALKYRLGVNIVSEKSGINVAGDVFLLSDYIQMGVDFQGATSSTFADRKAAITKVESAATKISAGYSKSSVLYSATNAEKLTSAEYAALVVYMPETVGNVANHKTGTNPPSIQLGLDVFATQYTYEEDSFGADYDAGAPWVGETDTTWYDASKDEFTLMTAAQLAGLAEIVNKGDSFEGKSVMLGADMDLNNVNWTPIGVSGSPFKGTFNGNNHTIYNLKAVGEAGVGLFGRTYVGAHIVGVKVVNAYVSGNDYVGVIVGGGYLAANCIKNCVVENATVIAMPYLMANGEYDGGAKAGVIVGQAYNGNIIGNSVKNANVMAYRDLGGIAGMLSADGTSYDITASGNTVESVSLSYIGVAGKYADNTPNQNMGEVVGRVGNKTVVDEKNTVSNVTMNKANEGAVAIYTLAELIKFANDVNAGNTYEKKTVLLGADIDLANMEWTPIGNSTNKFQGTFDGNGKTVSNLKITGNKSDVGLFGFTTNGEIKNLTVENANVSGRLNVGVVAGNPYTSKYTNIKVTGHVEVNGSSYVGGVGGKNAYANWTDVTVDVDETSYVKAISTVDGLAYRTYVGGVVGFNGEGGHTFKNITSNIDVIGDVSDIGGVFGIAHYNNKFENITCTGDVTNLISSENDGDDAATDVLETGLIAGVWHNQNDTTVTFTNVSATGEIFTPNVKPASKFANKGWIGKAYKATGTGKLIVEGEEVVATVAALQRKLDAATGTTIITLAADITGNVTVTQKPDVKITIDGKGYDYGKGYNYMGIITVNGQSKRYETAALTIQDVNFCGVTGSGSNDAYVKLGGNDNIRYTDNVTVKDCTFSGTDKTMVAVKSYTGGDWNVTLDNLTVNAGMHSLAQLKNVEEGLKVVNCKVYSKNGLNINSSYSLVMEGCTFDVQGYAVRFGDSTDAYAEVYSITNSTLKSACADGDPVIEFRNSGISSTLTLTNTKLEGTTTFKGNTAETIIKIDNAPVVSSNEGLTAAVADGAMEVYLLDGEYDLKGNQKDGLTLIGIGDNVKMANTTNFAGNGKLGGIVWAIKLENMTITDTVYTMENGGNATFTNVNFAAGFRQGYGTGVVFTDCTFGSNSEGYALHFQADDASASGQITLKGCKFEGGKVHLGGKRTYAFTNCDFAAGTDFQVWSSITLENCTVAGVAVTAANIQTLFPNLSFNMVTVK